jgi:hypothetical protein
MPTTKHQAAAAAAATTLKLRSFVLGYSPPIVAGHISWLGSSDSSLAGMMVKCVFEERMKTRKQHKPMYTDVNSHALQLGNGD